MKWRPILLIGLGVGWWVSPWVLAQDPGGAHPEEGWQGQHPEKDRDQASYNGRVPREGEGFRRGPREMGFMGSSERGPGRDRDFGGPPDRGGGGGPEDSGRFRGRFGRVGTAELMAFLKEHEPELAAKLDKLHKGNEHQFERQMNSLKRMYGPIMRMMEENPAMAKLSLKGIRLRVQVQETVKEAKEATEETAKQEAIKELKGKLEELFDVIISLEGLRLESFQKRMQERPMRLGSRRGEESKTGAEGEARERRGTQGGPGGYVGEGRGGPTRRGSPGGFDRERFAEFARSRVEQKKKNIEIWKENKTGIVQQRIEELLKGVQPFPWGG